MDPEKGKKHILAEARAGRLDPVAAEELSLEMGWGRLWPLPDANDFSPEIDRYWTLAQCIAWLSWGTNKALLALDPLHANSFRIWRKTSAPASNLEKLVGMSTGQGYELVPALPPSIGYMLLQERNNQLPLSTLPPPAPSVANALGFVIWLLQDGYVEASAAN